MPVFKKNDNTVLFIHIPKTAGTSIETAFMDSGYEREFLHIPAKGEGPDKKPCNPQHWHHGLIQRWIYPIESSYEFTIVRNPFTRCISEMMWKQGRRDKFNDKFFSNLQSFVIANLEIYIKNEKQYQSNKGPWLSGDREFHADNHWRPQWHFIGDRTKVYKYEELEKCWNDLQQKYKLSALPVTHAKLDLSTPRPTKMGIEPSDKFKELYTQVYGEDHRRFDYDLPF